MALLGLNLYAIANSAQDKDKPSSKASTRSPPENATARALAEADIKGYVPLHGDKVIGASKDGTPSFAAEYTLDHAKTPCVIVMKLTAGTDKGKELKGLVERKEDVIRVIYAGPGADAPTEFKTKQNQAMYTLKAEK